jgi:hypothetical protein
MNRILWIASRWMKHLGLPGMAGIVLVMIAVAGYLSIVFLEQSRLEELTQEVASEQKRQKTASLNPARDNHSPAAQLHEFYEFFPPRQKAPNLLKAIYKTAREELIILPEGEYKFELGKAGGVGIYQINLPVKGTYIQIRKFIGKVLNSVPSAALEEVSFKRDTIGSGELEAKIRFVVYLKVMS